VAAAVVDAIDMAAIMAVAKQLCPHHHHHQLSASAKLDVCLPSCVPSVLPATWLQVLLLLARVSRRC
jgi:hypothetical protein